MADRTISVDLIGRDRSLSSSLSGAGDAAENTGSRIGKVAKGIGATLGAAGAVGGGLLAKGFADNMNIEAGNAKLAAQLDLSKGEADKAGKVAGEVYSNNWGESTEQINEALRAVDTNLADVGKSSAATLQGMTESALILAQTFDVDVNASTAAAGSLIKNGLAKNSAEAFDIITAGFQNGADKAGDFTDTLTEYSPQFSKLGFDGKYSLDLLSEGLKAGARDTDVIADGFKEFGLRAIDGSETTKQAYKDIGLNAKDTAKAIAGGGPAAQVATQQVLDSLLKIKDPQKQNNAGVALFGTTWEDTVRTILPALANADGAIEKVDGSTKRAGDTISDTAQGKIDTARRSFEQWTQSMASSDGALGLAVTSVATFGGSVLTMGSQLGIAAVALRGTAVASLAANAATKVLSGGLKLLRLAWIAATGPVGLTVLAVIAVGAALVVAWRKSQTFREVLTTAFSIVATAVLTYVEVIIGAARAMTMGVLNAVGGILNAVAKIPGPTQEAAKKAAAGFDEFKTGVDRTFEAAERKVGQWKTAVQQMPQKVRLQGEISDLNAKIDAAKAKLRTVPASRRAAIRADISQLQAAADRANAKLHGIKDRYVNVYISELRRDRATAGRAPSRNARGGPLGAGELSWVGEEGPELVQFDRPSTVIPAGRSARMARHGGGDTYIINVHGNGERALGDALIRALEARPAGAKKIPRSAVA